MKYHFSAILSLILATAAVKADDAVQLDDPPPPLREHTSPTPMNQLNQESMDFQEWVKAQGRDLPSDMSPRIVNGVEVNPPFKYPFMVRSGCCGASLVAPNVLLSAAHCISCFPSTVQIGRHNLFNGSEDYETLQVVAKVAHPSYSSNTMANDFMMVKLGSSSTFAPVDLESATIGGGVELTVMGWGTTSSGGSASSRLLEVDVDSMTNTACKAKYGSGSITDDMLCAGRTVGGTTYDSCQGDSGGPIIQKATGKQVGVVSWGYGCANPNYPGVYSRISDELSWINSYINQWSSGTTPTPPAPTPTPPSPPATCTDISFTDSYGDSCSWYNSQSRCDVWGDCCNIGQGTANQNCCQCGGGNTGGGTPSPPTCTDIPFTDSYGDSCSWYNSQARCENWGNCCNIGQGTANQNCCQCGGGNIS